MELSDVRKEMEYHLESFRLYKEQLAELERMKSDLRGNYRIKAVKAAYWVHIIEKAMDLISDEHKKVVELKIKGKKITQIQCELNIGNESITHAMQKMYLDMEIISMGPRWHKDIVYIENMGIGSLYIKCPRCKEIIKIANGNDEENGSDNQELEPLKEISNYLNQLMEWKQVLLYQQEDDSNRSVAQWEQELIDKIKVVEQAVDHLPDKERALIQRRFMIRDKAYDYEVFTELGMSHKNYYKFKRKALETLKKVLAERNWE